MRTGETNEGVRKLVREGYTRVARAEGTAVVKPAGDTISGPWSRRLHGAPV